MREPVLGAFLYSMSLGLLLSCLLTPACRKQDEEEPGSRALVTGRFGLNAATSSIVIPWGDDESMLGFVSGGGIADSVGMGPQSAALMPGRGFAVLDGLKRRIALYGKDGAFMGSVPADGMAVDFCVVESDGYATLNMAGMRIQERGPDGRLRGERQLSPAFKSCTGIDCRNGRLLLSTAYQESYDAAAARPLASKREGIAGFDGAHYSLSLAVSDLSPGLRKLVLWRAMDPLLKGADEGAEQVASWDTQCSAARLLGVTYDSSLVVLCDRVDGGEGEGVTVKRRLDILSPKGTVLKTFDIGSGLEYLPFRGFRVYGSRVLMALPGVEGLELRVVDLSREGL